MTIWRTVSFWETLKGERALEVDVSSDTAGGALLVAEEKTGKKMDWRGEEARAVEDTVV